MKTGLKGTTRFIFFWGYMLTFAMAVVRVVGTFTPIDLSRISSLDSFILVFAGIISATKAGDKIVELGEKNKTKEVVKVE